MVFDEKSRKKSGKKWPFLTPIFWPFHRCETGKRGYGVKFQVSQIKKWLAFLIDRVSAISNLPEGVYKILWKDVGCYPYWQRKDEVEDVFSWWIEEAIEGQMCLFDMPEWIDNI